MAGTTAANPSSGPKPPTTSSTEHSPVQQLPTHDTSTGSYEVTPPDRSRAIDTTRQADRSREGQQVRVGLSLSQTQREVPDTSSLCTPMHQDSPSVSARHAEGPSPTYRTSTPWRRTRPRARRNRSSPPVQPRTGSTTLSSPPRATVNTIPTGCKSRAASSAEPMEPTAQTCDLSDSPDFG